MFSSPYQRAFVFVDASFFIGLAVTIAFQARTNTAHVVKLQTQIVLTFKMPSDDNRQMILEANAVYPIVGSDEATIVRIWLDGVGYAFGCVRILSQ